MKKIQKGRKSRSCCREKMNPLPGLKHRLQTSPVAICFNGVRSIATISVEIPDILIFDL
jgi:hypothetical protein